MGAPQRNGNIGHAAELAPTDAVRIPQLSAGSSERHIEALLAERATLQAWTSCWQVPCMRPGMIREAFPLQLPLKKCCDAESTTTAHALYTEMGITRNHGVHESRHEPRA